MTKIKQILAQIPPFLHSAFDWIWGMIAAAASIIYIILCKIIDILIDILEWLVKLIRTLIFGVSAFIAAVGFFILALGAAFYFFAEGSGLKESSTFQDVRESWLLWQGVESDVALKYEFLEHDAKRPEEHQFEGEFPQFFQEPYINLKLMRDLAEHRWKPLPPPEPEVLEEEIVEEEE